MEAQSLWKAIGDDDASSRILLTKKALNVYEAVFTSKNIIFTHILFTDISDSSLKSCSTKRASRRLKRLHCHSINFTFH